MRRVVHALFIRVNRFFSWPTAERARAVNQEFAASGFPDTIGAIDGANRNKQTHGR